ncbi:OmpA family protein [Emcibacter sp. SYSU 3D8]|uniref:OmpA family protein n=1 Tax=Emcibacter sp. SYSU 3D8 TaxID=3133969 RepID=UPI0031FE4653
MTTGFTLCRNIVTYAAIISLTGCMASVDHYKRNPDEAPTVQGPPVTDNTTPLEGTFQCMAQKIRENGRNKIRVAVGTVKDYTGKFSESEGGNPITQGGSLMVMSALGKLGDAVRMQERFDTQVTELELRYLDRRYLGDGSVHEVRGKTGSSQKVPWKPYYGGTVIESDYFIVGGITELNYNVQSGGLEVNVDGFGGKGRVFTVNVAADLRIVDTSSLEVLKTVSLQKQITGYEVGANVFNFFKNTLVDVNAGLKSQEPLQLGVRTVLELGVLELVGAVTGVDEKPLVNFEGVNSCPSVAGVPVAVAPEEPPPPPEAPVPPKASTFTVYFATASAQLTPEAAKTIADAAAAARAGQAANLLLEGHADTQGGELYNLDLSRRRAVVVQEALVKEGIPKNRISLVWYGESQPAVKTGDNAAEPLNRRVVIQILEDTALLK